MTVTLLVVLLLVFIVSLFLTPVIIKFAYKIGAVDKPNYRKVHQKVMPRIGGLTIFLSFLIGVFILRPESPDLLPILAGAFVIIIIGIIDDITELSALYKLLGQSFAAVIVISSGLYMQMITLPIIGPVELGTIGIPLTFLWIIGVTNAINLIDGLDGLAAGVSSIVLVGIATIAFLDGHLFIFTITTLLLFSILGFLPYNFFPAKVFMGDTGALFLGFMLSVISLLGFKGVTLFSIIIPIVILGVPISDTLFAIIRRVVNKKKLSAPDKSHLHHCLLRNGFSHRNTVLMIYLLSTFFMISAILLSQATFAGALLIVFVVLFVTEIVAEKVGLLDMKFTPLLNLIDKTMHGRRRLG